VKNPLQPLRVEQALRLHLPAALRPDQEEPHADEQDQNEDVAAHWASSHDCGGEPSQRLGLERSQPALLDRRACVRGQFKQES